MHLDEYLFRTKQTQVCFAKKVGVHPQYLSHLIAGRNTPSISLAKKIDKYSEGAVSWIEIIEYCTEKKLEREGRENPIRSKEIE